MKYVFAAALALASAVAAQPKAIAATSNPCSLLSNAEASRYAGAAVTGKAYGTQCRYTAHGRPVSVGVGIISGPTAGAQFNAMKSQGKPVGGLGSPAYYAAGSITVMKGQVLYVISLMRGIADIKTMNPQLPELTKLVLSRV